MGEIVKGIEIPDDAYLAYAEGAGPQNVNANQLPDVPIEAATDIPVTGMRLRDVLNVAKITQGITTLNSTKTVTSLDFLIQTFTFNTSTLVQGDAALEVFDSAAEAVASPIPITVVQ